jgi:hypothetical protein
MIDIGSFENLSLGKLMTSISRVPKDYPAESRVAHPSVFTKSYPPYVKPTDLPPLCYAVGPLLLERCVPPQRPNHCLNPGVAGPDACPSSSLGRMVYSGHLVLLDEAAGISLRLKLVPVRVHSPFSFLRLPVIFIVRFHKWVFFPPRETRLA